MSLKRQQQLCLDGIETCVGMTSVAYSRLRVSVWSHSEARRSSGPTSEISKVVLLDAWSLIDVTYKLRVLVGRTRGLKKNAAVKSFLKATDAVETLRHYVQHLDRELGGLADTGWPIWGSLSWAEPLPGGEEPTQIGISVLIPGSFAKSRGYPVVNPAGKVIEMPVDHISLSTLGATVNLSDVARATALFGQRLEAAIVRARQAQTEPSSGDGDAILRIVLDFDRGDQAPP